MYYHIIVWWWQLQEEITMRIDVAESIEVFNMSNNKCWNCCREISSVEDQSTKSLREKWSLKRFAIFDSLQTGLSTIEGRKETEWSAHKM